MLTTSIAACRVLQSQGVHPAFVAGHSLGEYPAHVAAGTFALADAVRIVRRRGRYMQEAVPVGEGSMAAIVGTTLDVVRQACEEAADGQIVSPANINGRWPDRHRGPCGRSQSRVGASEGARGETSSAAAGERAVPLRAHEACRGPARARAARADGPGSPRSRRRQRRRRAEAYCAGKASMHWFDKCRRRSSGRPSFVVLRQRASPRMLR